MDDRAGKLVVRAIADDKLHLVVTGQPVEIGQVVASGLAAARALDVDHLHDVVRHLRDVDMTTGLQQYRLTCRQQGLHQGIHVALEQRLAPGDLDEGASKGADGRHHSLHRLLLPRIERVGRVAPGTPQVTSGQSNEDAGPSCMTRFSLDGEEDLVDGQHRLFTRPEKDILVARPHVERTIILPCPRALSESERAARIIRLAAAPGTASSIPPRTEAAAPAGSTSSRILPSTSIQSR